MAKNNMKLADRIINHLKQNEDQKFTARELSLWFMQNFSQDCENKRQASSQDLSDDQKMIKQITAEIYTYIEKFKEQGVKTTAERPRRFYFPKKIDIQKEEDIERLQEQIEKLEQQENTLSEYDLYPKLNDFLWNQFKIYPKRIDEKNSTRTGKNANKWVHPDIVALEDLKQNWVPGIKDCAEKNSAQTIKLWSFEVKTKLDSSNVRESFFQAVSNSSWANYGYLVASEINDDIRNELKILNKLHGIGIINLNIEDPIESQILIYAREVYEIDWDGANRIASINKDFKRFIEQVNDSFNTKIREDEWDIPKVREDEWDIPKD